MKKASTQAEIGARHERRGTSPSLFRTAVNFVNRKHKNRPFKQPDILGPMPAVSATD